MRTTVTARNFELGAQLRDRVERKIGRLARVLHPDAEAKVELIANASRSAPQAYVAEVVLDSNGLILRSESAGPTLIAAVDTLLDQLDRQVARAKERPREVRDRRPASSVAAGTAPPPRGTVATSPTSIASPRIVRIKRFSMTPMFEEDAIARMTELGHAFFVFLNAETDRIGVVYARHDGSFGLIDPVTGEA